MKQLLTLSILLIVFISECLSSSGRYSTLHDTYQDEPYKQYIEDEYRRDD